VMGPVATSSAANKVVVPCRTSSWCAARAAEPDAAHGLGGFHGLDLGLLVHTEDHSPLWWVLVEADDVVDLGRKLGGWWRT
jgi:hypothetical protein